MHSIVSALTAIFMVKRPTGSEDLPSSRGIANLAMAGTVALGAMAAAPDNADAGELWGKTYGKYLDPEKHRTVMSESGFAVETSVGRFIIHPDGRVLGRLETSAGVTPVAATQPQEDTCDHNGICHLTGVEFHPLEIHELAGDPVFENGRNIDVDGGMDEEQFLAILTRAPEGFPDIEGTGGKVRADLYPHSVDLNRALMTTTAKVWEVCQDISDNPRKFLPFKDAEGNWPATRKEKRQCMDAKVNWAKSQLDVATAEERRTRRNLENIILSKADRTN